MAKRMFDTDIWKKRWFRVLPPDIKNVWFYLLTMCDHAGIYNVDLDIMGIFIGAEIDEGRVMKYLGDRITVLDNGNKWFIPTFVEFQYRKLSDKNSIHRSVIDRLKRHDLLKNGIIAPLIQNEVRSTTTPLEGVTEGVTERVIEGAKAKDKDKDKDKVIYSSKSNNKKSKSKRFRIPSIEEINKYCSERKNGVDPEKFLNHYQSNGWMVGKVKMSNWQAAVRNWEKNSNEKKTQRRTGRGAYIQPGDLEKKRGW